MAAAQGCEWKRMRESCSEQPRVMFGSLCGEAGYLERGHHRKCQERQLPGHDEGPTFLSGQFYFFRSPALLRVLWCEFPLGTPWESSPCPSNRGAPGEDGQRSPHFQPSHLGSCLCPSLSYMSPSNSTCFLPVDSGGADF